MRDGIAYYVEIRNENKYRLYYYADPSYQEFEDAKKFSKLIEILNNGFGDLENQNDE